MSLFYSKPAKHILNPYRSTNNTQIHRRLENNCHWWLPRMQCDTQSKYNMSSPHSVKTLFSTVVLTSLRGLISGTNLFSTCVHTHSTLFRMSCPLFNYYFPRTRIFPYCAIRLPRASARMKLLGLLKIVRGQFFFHKIRYKWFNHAIDSERLNQQHKATVSKSKNTFILIRALK